MTKKNKVLVTGGAGFIGSHLVQTLADCGYSVKILDNLTTGKISNIAPMISSGTVNFIEGDIRDVELVKKSVEGADAVIHLAAQTSVPLSIQNPDFNNDVNIKGTLNLLNSSAETNVGKFIFISSCAVYGDPTCLPVDEKVSADPISPYAQSKLVSEQECLRLNEKHFLKSVVFRFFNVYGPRQGLNDYSGVITKFMDKIKQKAPLIIYGDGSQTRDFVYVKDIVNAIVLGLENEKAEGEIFNVGSGKPTTIQELAQTMLSLAGVNLEIQNVPPRLGDIKQSYGNINKANKQLGYKPLFTLKEGLQELLSQNCLLPFNRGQQKNSDL